MTRHSYTVGSLFSGIGGLDLGFEWAGFRVAWNCEADPFCRAVLARHWPGVECYDDVRTLRVADADGWRCDGKPDVEGASAAGRRRTPEGGVVCRVDVLIGGFPCQDVSDAGKRAGLVAGARSGLWREFRRLIGELRPRAVCVENVAGLFVRGLDVVLGDLASLGYDAEWQTLRAADVGAPHRRERIFIVAYPGRDGCGGRCKSEPAWLEGARGAQPDGRRDGRASAEGVADATSRGQRVERGTPQPWHDGHPDGHDAPVDDAAESRLERHQPSPSDEGHLYGRAAGPTRWPARPGESQHAWEPPRTLRRAESGMGVVPDGLSRGLVRHRRRALAALGNAVVPQVAEVVAWRVRQILEGGGA